MKRIILLLFLFFNLFPVIEKGKLIIQGPAGSYAQSYGEEDSDYWDDYMDDYFADSGPVEFGNNIAYSVDLPVVNVYGSSTNVTLPTTYISGGGSTSFFDSYDFSSMGITLDPVNVYDNNSIMLDEVTITATTSDPAAIIDFYNLLNSYSKTFYNQWQEQYTEDPNNTPQPPQNPPVTISPKIDSIPCPTSTEDLKNTFVNAPTTTLDELRNILNEYMDDFGIDTKEKLQHFLAQAGHETGGFRNLGVKENLNYSVQGLINTWPTRFSKTDPNKQDPNNYAYNPQKIANFVYGGMSGNTLPGDGYKFRGRGIFQLTGKSNYQEFQNFYNANYDSNIDLISNPDLLVTDHTLAVLSALWFFQKRVLDKMTIDANTTVESVTKKVNGGEKGISDRKTKYNSAKLNIDCN